MYSREKNYDIIKRIFRREISRFDKGIGSLLRGNELEYSKELYKILDGTMRNHDTYLSNLLFFIKENFSKIKYVQFISAIMLT